MKKNKTQRQLLDDFVKSGLLQNNHFTQISKELYLKKKIRRTSQSIRYVVLTSRSNAIQEDIFICICEKYTELVIANKNKQKIVSKAISDILTT